MVLLSVRKERKYINDFLDDFNEKKIGFNEEGYERSEHEKELDRELEASESSLEEDLQLFNSEECKESTKWDIVSEKFSKKEKEVKIRLGELTEDIW